VRVIAATNKNLEELVEKGLFRRDLFYRLNVIQISIPPLRDRPEDIEVLVDHFIERLSKSLGKEIKGYDRSFIEPLLQYRFPGNVRELQNIIERAIVTANTPILTRSNLPQELFKNEDEGYVSSAQSFDALRKQYIEHVLLETNYNISETARRLGVSRPTLYSLIRKYSIQIP
jgi:Response regulator containing CheY-like receiver, AAA-type ATPase, and DNA-binding domains